MSASSTKDLFGKRFFALRAQNDGLGGVTIKFEIKKQLVSAEGNINLEVGAEVKANEFVTLFGESGAGKTSVLRMLAGLMSPQEGYIEVDGQVWFDSRKGINWSVQKRSIGFVFQDYSLFPNMTVRENLIFALSDRKNLSFLEELLETMQLRGLQNSRPGNLSGGQKQRVALIRAILRQPKIFLLDEPFAALDVPMRLKLHEDMMNIYRRYPTTTIFVSHDLSEVVKLSNQILVLEEGKIIKSGHPNEILVEPQISGKFKFSGQITAIQQDGVVCIVTVQIGNNFTKVVATPEEAADFKIGERVMVATKAFNPIILKYHMLK